MPRLKNYTGPERRKFRKWMQRAFMAWVVLFTVAFFLTINQLRSQNREIKQTVTQLRHQAQELKKQRARNARRFKKSDFINCHRTNLLLANLIAASLGAAGIDYLELHFDEAVNAYIRTNPLYALRTEEEIHQIVARAKKRIRRFIHLVSDGSCSGLPSQKVNPSS